MIVLDTDHIGIIQRRTGPEYSRLAALLAQPNDDFRKAAECMLQKNKELYQKLEKALEATNGKYGGAPKRLGD